jgi:HD superfamily phosphohydrolase YqeK
VKSINVTVNASTLAKAEKLASEKKTSVAGLLRDYLRQLTNISGSRQVARRRIKRLSAAAKGEVGPRDWTRDDLYDR